MSGKRQAREVQPGQAGSRCRFCRRGFSLIEVLIALSVLAVTMTAAFSIFSSGIRVRSATRDRMVFDRDARLLLAALADDFANLIPTGPRPFVSADVIVLLRYPREIPGGAAASQVAQLVTYQWSGSAFQDSSLIRVTTPLAVDLSDSTLVAEEFRKWANEPSDLGEYGQYMTRHDPGFRFGSEAGRKGLEGSWVGYPEIREFGFIITGALNEAPSEDRQESYNPDHCRLRVRLGAETVTGFDNRFDRIFPGSWESDSGQDIEAGLWVPLVSYQQASLTAGDDGGGR